MEEKLDYVQSLWDHISAHPDEVPVPDWHKRIVEDRLAAHRANPSAARPWEEIREELQERIRNRSRRA